MNRDGWIAVGVGVGAGALVLWLARRPTGPAHAPMHTAPLSSDALGSPIEGDALPRVTPHGFFGAPRGGPPVHTHQGVDLQARPGSHVLAIGDGKILDAKPGLGLVVRKLELDNPAAWTPDGRPVRWVVYADLGEVLTQPGDSVRRGDPIALVHPRGFVHFAVKDAVALREQFFDPADAGFLYRKPEVA